MKKLLFAEATLSAGNVQGFKEKLEIARLLASVHTDIIETCPVTGNKADEILIKTIAAQTVNSIVSCPVTDGNVNAAYAAVEKAAHPRLNIKLPVSVVQMEYFSHLKPAKMLDYIGKTVTEAKALCKAVEFTALDATRAERAYLINALRAAKEAGAETLTLSDDEGNMLPQEFALLAEDVLSEVIGNDGTVLGVRTGTNLSMAEACAFAAVTKGAGLVYVMSDASVLPGFKVLNDIVTAKGDHAGICSGIDATSLSLATRSVAQFCSTSETAIPTLRQQKDTSKYALPADTSIEELNAAAADLGYELTSEDKARVYERFKTLADRKDVDNRELEAIIASVACQVPATYTLKSYVVNSGNIITSTAHIMLDRNGETVQGISTGDGSIDAALMAIEQAIGHHYELDDLEIRAVTEGRDAMGEAIIKLRDGGRLYSGRGISTDIVGAAIRAYLNALNKIIYRED